MSGAVLPDVVSALECLECCSRRMRFREREVLKRHVPASAVEVYMSSWIRKTQRDCCWYGLSTHSTSWADDFAAEQLERAKVGCYYSCVCEKKPVLDVKGSSPVANRTTAFTLSVVQSAIFGDQLYSADLGHLRLLEPSGVPLPGFHNSTYLRFFKIPYRSAAYEQLGLTPCLSDVFSFEPVVYDPNSFVTTRLEHDVGMGYRVSMNENYVENAATVFVRLTNLYAGDVGSVIFVNLPNDITSTVFVNGKPEPDLDCLDDGLCYLKLFREEHQDAMRDALGLWPTLGRVTTYRDYLYKDDAFTSYGFEFSGPNKVHVVLGGRFSMTDMIRWMNHYDKFLVGGREDLHPNDVVVMPVSKGLSWHSMTLVLDGRAVELPRPRMGERRCYVNLVVTRPVLLRFAPGVGVGMSDGAIFGWANTRVVLVLHKSVGILVDPGGPMTDSKRRIEVYASGSSIVGQTSLLLKTFCDRYPSDVRFVTQCADAVVLRWPANCLNSVGEPAQSCVEVPVTDPLDVHSSVRDVRYQGRVCFPETVAVLRSTRVFVLFGFRASEDAELIVNGALRYISPGFRVATVGGAACQLRHARHCTAESLVEGVDWSFHVMKVQSEEAVDMDDDDNDHWLLDVAASFGSMRAVSLSQFHSLQSTAFPGSRSGTRPSGCDVSTYYESDGGGSGMLSLESDSSGDEHGITLDSSYSDSETLVES